MVEGMPVVDHVEQVCDGCTLGKQHRAPFPQSSNFRASSGLELVHADLCGQIVLQNLEVVPISCWLLTISTGTCGLKC